MLPTVGFRKANTTAWMEIGYVDLRCKSTQLLHQAVAKPGGPDIGTRERLWRRIEAVQNTD